jgi:nucleotide-binding universal stress UspA family protein
MFPPRKILFPTDYSDRCKAAARMVETFTGHFQAEATFLHVVEPLTYHDLPPAIDSSRSDKLKAWLADDFEQFDVKRVLAHGEPAHKIVEYARTMAADLIMLPTRGYGTFRRFILGSVTAKVLHDAECPVWTGVHMEQVAPLETIVFRNVLCAVDLGKQSALALEWATRFASEFQAKLTIVHALAGLGDETARIGQLQASAGSDAEVRIVSGEVPAAVRSCAEETQADLLVIGRSVEEGITGRLRTNAWGILLRSPCPVISV